MKVSVRLVILPLLSIAACGDSVAESEPWMAPAQPQGKADAIATLTGADIPSA